MSAIPERPALTKLVRADLHFHYKGKFSWWAVFTHLRRPSFFAVFLYRLSAALRYKGMLGKIASMFFARLLVFMFACEIAPESIIGPGLLLPHPIGIVVGRATLGNDVIVMQNVSLGLRRLSDDGEVWANYPTIGDNVFLSTGCVILGPITIGKDAVIGANAVVLKDVPEGVLAAGVPARIIENNRSGQPARPPFSHPE